MAITATRLDTPHGFRGDAALYHLSEPVAVDSDGTITTQHVIVSAADVPYSGPETYIFPANADGKITGWSEMDGSRRGTLSHTEVIEAAGWELAR